MNSGGGLPWRAGLVLTLLVVAVHGWLLRSATVVAPDGRPLRPAHLQVRTLVVPGPPVGTSTGGRPVAAEATAPVPRVPVAAVPRATAATASAAVPADGVAPAARATDTAPAVHAAEASRTGDAPRAPGAPRAASMASAEPPRAAVPPEPATLHYEARAQVRGSVAQGAARLRWQHDGSRYEAELAIVLPDRPPRLQRSIGSITPGGLAPERFSDHLRSEQAAHFNPARQRIVFSTNQPEAPLERGAQDRLSVLLQLAALVAAEPGRYPVGSMVRVQTASTREADLWWFSVTAAEELSLPGGTLATLRLTRRPHREHEPLLELWLGPGPDYAPVRLRLTQPGGDWLDLQWSGTDRG